MPSTSGDYNRKSKVLKILKFVSKEVQLNELWQIKLNNLIEKKPAKSKVQESKNI